LTDVKARDILPSLNERRDQMTLTNGTRVEFALNIPYVGTKKGAGIVIGEGDFAILGESYTVRAEQAGDYKAGERLQVCRSSMTKITA
jgi:hypothetical protein